MPRQSRIQIKGSLHHVMARGIYGQDIFADKKDYNRFLGRLGELITGSDHTCYAWALLSNHFHLLIKTGDNTLSSLMRRLLTSHAVYFNRRHKRFGHLFQNRFKSILCQEDTYFLQLIRYIHLNPIRVGSVKSLKTLNKYPYTGHACLMDQFSNDWQDTSYPLQWFGKQKQRAQKRYLNYIKEGIPEGRREDLTGGGLLRTVGGWKKLKELRIKGRSTLGDERMLGDSDFVELILKQVEHSDDTIEFFNKHHTLEQLTEEACRFFELQTIDVRSGCKQRHLTQAKSIICYTAVRILKMKGAEVATYLGLSKSAVSKMVNGFQHSDVFNQFIKNHLKI